MRDTPVTYLFRIELLPAGHGDCILVTYGPADSPRFVLIDSGPIHTYKAVRQRIQKAAPSGRIELLVVSHIDADHIEGAINLLNEPECRLKFRDVWFNGWPQLKRALRGDVPFAPGTSGHRGPTQGAYFTVRLHDRGTGWNSHFRGGPVLVPDVGRLPTLELEGGMRLTLLSPSARRLLALRSAWSAALRAPGNLAAHRRKLAQDPRYRSGEVVNGASLPLDEEIQTAVENRLDDAVANGSSIAFVAEFRDRRCAFLADAHMQVVEGAVARLAAERNEARLRLDAVKVSHHGSRGNTTSRFLERIKCDTYLVSTDGSHFDHPDDEAIERILARGSDHTRLVFNYRSERNAKWADAALQEKRRYVTCYPPAEEAGIFVDLIDPGMCSV